MNTPAAAVVVAVVDAVLIVHKTHVDVDHGRPSFVNISGSERIQLLYGVVNRK